MTIAAILKDSNFKISQFNLPEIQEFEICFEWAKRALEVAIEKGEEQGMRLIENFSKS